MMMTRRRFLGGLAAMGAAGWLRLHRITRRLLGTGMGEVPMTVPFEVAPGNPSPAPSHYDHYLPYIPQHD